VFLLLPAALLGSGACDSSPDRCAEACRRASRCKAEVGHHLVAHLPKGSPALEQARRDIRQHLFPALLENCPARCERLWEYSVWRQRLRACDPADPCDAFARCFSSALLP
jgi:hypothetical protein